MLAKSQRYRRLSNTDKVSFVSLRVEILETNQGMTQGSSALMSESTMESLGIFTNDIVEILGGRKTVAFCHPESWSFSAHATKEGKKDWIMMNAETRNNAEVKLGDKVIVRKTRAKVAGRVYLLPMYQAAFNVTSEHLKTRSSNPIAVMIGDNMVAGFHSGRQMLQVVRIEELSDAAGTRVENMEQYMQKLAQRMNTTVTPESQSASEKGVPSSDSEDLEMAFIIYPRVTEFEILGPTGHSLKQQLDNQKVLKPLRGFPAFWVDVGLGGNTDAMLNKYLSLHLSLSYYEGSVNANYEIGESDIAGKRRQKQPEPFDFGIFLEGLKEAAEGKSGMHYTQADSGAMAAMRRIMDPLGGIQSVSIPYIEEAAKIVEQANEDWQRSPGSISPTDLKFKILKRWTEI